ncbi:MAG: cold shock and DUF1294 domain-containing protein [Pseudomonadaceae bacterium]|nr:cold shock and DUF1294 domain-containing protein [Pseudomonadaceae bacterium]
MNKSTRYRGRVTTWKDDRGYGFITPNGGGSEVFVHISALKNRSRRLAENETVEYQIRTDAQGRRQAFRVRTADDSTEKSKGGNRATPIVFAGLFIALVAGLVAAGKLPSFMFAIYSGMSTLAFITYALDKSAARRDASRTPEKNLHLLALAGGWPGALVARHLLRHKSKKQPFVQMFWVTVVINSIALVWSMTSQGQHFLQSVTTSFG